tara:strand:+ start:969 stop:1385 length:417 start_codon:yes stop_codon:yes gene_type:complete
MNELNNKQKNKLEENACSVTTTYTQRNSKDMIVMKRFHFTDAKELLGSWLALDSLRGVNDNLRRVDGFNVTLDISDLCITENSQMSIHAYYHDVLCNRDGRCICGNIHPDTAYCHMDEAMCALVDKRQKELSEKDGEE